MNDNSGIQKTKTRDSNIELLRILAMLLVLVVHTNFFSIGAPTHAEALTEPTKSFARFLIQSISIICVNLFIFISGWYGIRPKLSRFLEFIFQIVFFYAILFTIFHFKNPEEWTIKASIRGILLVEDANWFIKSYIFLYLISPVLNKYVESATKSSFKWLIIAFFCFQFFYGWFYSAVKWFDRGYSTISFVGIYLLASYIKRHSSILVNMAFWKDVALWLVLTLITTGLAFLTIQYTKYNDNRLYFYNSPFVIAATVFIFLAFNRLHFKSAIVNWIAISCFAAFLLHCNPAFMEDVFKPYVISAYTEHTYPVFLAIALAFVLIVFFVAILSDKVRIAIWRLLCKCFQKKRQESD